MANENLGIKEVDLNVPAGQGVQSQPPVKPLESEPPQPAPSEAIVEDTKPDYETLYKQALEQNELLFDDNVKTASDRDNYRTALLRKKGKIDEDVEADEDDIDTKISRSIQNELAKGRVEDVLGDISNDPYEKKLIQLHYDNSIRHTGSSRDAILRDLENARLIANKSSILKTNRELKIALSNRSGISSSVSDSSEKASAEVQFFTKEQLSDLKKRGWTDKKIEAYKENLRRLKERSKI